MASSTSLLLILSSAASIPGAELDLSLAALLSSSCYLFGFAISTSDPLFEVLSLTLPRSAFKSLLPLLHVSVICTDTTRSARSGGNVTVNGVEVLAPGIFFGKNIVVPRSTDSPVRIGIGDLFPASATVLSGLPLDFQPLFVFHPPKYGKRQAPSPTVETQVSRSSSVSEAAATIGFPSGSQPPSSYTPLAPVQSLFFQDSRILPESPTFQPNLCYSCRFIWGRFGVW